MIAAALLVLLAAADAPASSPPRAPRLDYQLRSVLRTKGLFEPDRPICAGVGGSLVIVTYVVTNRSDATIDLGEIPLLQLVDGAGKAIAPDRERTVALDAIDRTISAQARTVAPGVGVFLADVFVLPTARLAEAGWRYRTPGDPRGRPLPQPQPMTAEPDQRCPD